ncbi:unnamed protein product [Kuraishia capsulata CBS 1993]|uniref:Aminomethyltransferase n=1 Tax=Kuraishia capsulata CBS 1993 TaxID=1382522 RepID=W6MIT0_9ASCO|nr:uncharacterized protein KUCA_T00000252001 [Kuraishia capsulata CBS 1993]CDK24292.1 unnamed protein product [Kuraishia capsulata CBS 1993]
MIAFRGSLHKNTVARFYSTASKADLIKTPLYDLHVDYGATIVPYAGFAMPVLYKGQSHIESHKWTRTNAGLFDVSHMLQHKVSGPGATDFLQKITPSDLYSLPPMTGTLSCLLNDNGGIVDDCIINKHGDDSFYIVTNAGCRAGDLAFIEKELSSGAFDSVSHSTFEGALLALQGPKAAQVLQKFTDYDLSSLYFGTSDFVALKGFLPDKVHVSRAGYTGEDGFEISIPVDDAAREFASALLELSDVVKPIGLAARDSLRLEAGMCLYGHEMNEATTPIESSLNWLVGKSRRSDVNGFNGAKKILSQLENPKSVTFKRVGITSKGPSPREGNSVFSFEDPEKRVGVIASGSPSPTLGGNVGQALLDKPFNKIGTKILIEIRGKKREAVVSKMPFVEVKYHRPS